MVAQGEHRDASPTVGRKARLAAGEVDHHHVRATGRALGCVRAAGGKVAQPLGAGVDHPGRPALIGVAGVRDVRQPFDPGPVRILGVIGEHPDLQLIGRMEHGQMADHRGQQAGCAGRIPADRDGRKGPQLQQFRAIVNQTVGAQKLHRPHVTDRFQIGLRCGTRAGEFAADGGLEQPVHGWLVADSDPGCGVEVRRGGT